MTAVLSDFYKPAANSFSCSCSRPARLHEQEKLFARGSSYIHIQYKTFTKNYFTMKHAIGAKKKNSNNFFLDKTCNIEKSATSNK